MKSKKHLNIQGPVTVSNDSERSFQSLRELALSSPDKNKIPVHGNKTLINPFHLDYTSYYPLKLDNYTLDSTSKPKNQNIQANYMIIEEWRMLAN